MTHRTLDHEERLRHALRAAAESVEPEGDGLERIRARITTPRPAAVWMAAGTEPAGQRTGPAAARLRSFRDSRAMRWLFPAADGGSLPPYRWLRPVAAMAAFVLIIGSGALALTTGSTSVLNANRYSKTGPAVHISQGGGGQPAGNGNQVSGGGGSSSAGSPTTAAPTTAPTSVGMPVGGTSPSPSGTCTTAPPSAKANPPTGTPTPTPSGTPTPSPSPDPSGSPSPSGSPTTSSSGTVTPPAPATSSATLDAAGPSATPTPKPKKHHPHPNCS